MYCDTHCHLNLEEFQQDLAEVIQRARDHGIYRILVPGIDIKTSILAVQLAEKFDIVFAAAGIHPNSVNSWNKNSTSELKQLLGHPKVVAVGEIGLDYYRNYVQPEDQRKALHHQFNLAAEFSKPVVLHCRQAFSDLVKEIEDWNSLGSRRLNGVFHAFSEGPQQIATVKQLGMMIGIGGPITYKNNARTAAALQAAGAGMTLLETDAPYLSPVPKRGLRNEPYYLNYVIAQVSNILNISEQDVKQITSLNADRLFHWDPEN